MRTRRYEYLAEQMIGLAIPIVVLYLMRHPDALRTVKMWTSRNVKHFAQTQADLWQKVADGAATTYNRAKI